MCLVKVKQEEDVVVPYRVVQRTRSPSPRRRASHTSVRRYSRNEVVREPSPRPSASYVAVPAPKQLQIPAPQPVPVFVEPPPMPMPVPAAPRSYAPSHAPSHAQSHAQSHASSHHQRNAHYVEVSPQSSGTSLTSSPGRSEYVYTEREVRRERAYSPEHNPRYEHFRYVEPAPSDSDYSDRYRRRDRSRSRGGYSEDPRGSFREHTRVSIEEGGRRREYRR